MDYAKMIGSFASGMQKDGKTKSTNPEAAAMLGDVGVALDENDKQRDSSYRDAFTNYMQGANQNLAQREMAAGAAANAAANAAGPAQSQMAVGAAMPAGGQVDPRVGLQAQMARAAMGQGGGQNLGAPGPSAALSNVQIDPRTGMAVAGGGGAPTPGDLQAAQAAATAYGGATPYPAVGAIYGQQPQMNDAALQAAYLRSRGM